MVDKSNQAVVDGLSRAAAEPAGLPLVGGKGSLFPLAARQAAQHCLDQGWLQVVKSEPRGKSVQAFYALTDKGLAHLLEQVNPRQLLEDLVRALEARQVQLDLLVKSARETQAGLHALARTTERVLQRLDNPIGYSLDWTQTILDYLQTRDEDCPLPELLRLARQTHPELTLGEFHDGLRRLLDERRIWLHPWTGPLPALPEPAVALLVGHEIAHYASCRR